MSQDSFHSHQGTDVSDDNGSAPPGTETDKEMEVKKPRSAGSSHSGSGYSAGQSKGKRSAKEVAVDTNDSDDDNVSKGKRKVAAPNAMGTSSRRMKQQPHNIAERERRKRMKGMYADLQALLPHIPKKADKATIVGEAISFIRVLEGTVAKLEKRKQALTLARRAAAVADLQAASSSAAPPIATQGSLDLPQGWAAWLPKQQPKPANAPPVGLQTWAGKDVVLSASNDAAFISMCVPRRARVLTQVLSILEKHRVDIITAQVSCNGSQPMFNIIARVNAAAIRPVDGEPPASEDIYKLAASEIMVCLSA